MKKIQIRISFVLAFLYITSLSFGQSMPNYFKYEGVKFLANLAHPMTTFKSGYYEVRANYVLVDIEYTDGTVTKLRLNRYKNAFTSIKVIADNDFFPPFSGILIAKELVYEFAKSNPQVTDDVTIAFEKMLKKGIDQFSGAELALVAINLDWFDY